MDNEEMREVAISISTVDCADYFARLVQNEFPNVRMEMKLKDAFRPVWFITLPPQEYEVTKVEAFCFDLMNLLFWEKDELITYTILREHADIHE